MAQDMRVELQSRRAERQLRRLNRGVDQLERKASDIDVRLDIDDRELRGVEQRLAALRKRITTQLDVQGAKGASSGGDVSGGADAGLIGAAALAQSAGNADGDASQYR